MLGLEQAQGFSHHRGEFAVRDQHLGFAVVHLPGQQRGVQPRIERIEHGAQGRHGVMRLHHLGCIGQHHADRAAAAHAAGPQRRCQSCRSLAQLRPGVAARAMDDGRPAAEDLGAALHETHR
jgi:hypothetical protein